MSSVLTNDDEKVGPGRIAATIILALLALVCFGETGRFLLAQQHHLVRIGGSAVLGVALALGAWFALRYQSLAAEEAREAERIAAAQEAVTAEAVAAADPAEGSAEAATSPGPQETAAAQA